MDICPRAIVDAPPASVLRYGLYSVANVIDSVDPHVFCGGITYEPEACGPDAKTWSHRCGEEFDLKVLEDKAPPIEADPFWVYDGLNCLPQDDPVAAARRRLALSEARAVEKAFWTGEQMNDPHLASMSAVAVAPNSVSVTGGLAALETYLAENYDGLGTIHAPRGIATIATHENLVVRSGSQLRTPLDNFWAFGSGYSVNTGPDGSQAPAGHAWMYATGQVTIWRGPVRVPTLAEALDRTDNSLHLIAERPIIVAADCVLAAVLVDFSCSCDC